LKKADTIFEKFKFDKGAFQILSHEEADREMKLPYHNDPKEKWAYLHYLKSRAYGLPPESKLKFERTIFEIIKRPD
jgi:hypothetical protein